jgi:hypothetical protein
MEGTTMKKKEYLKPAMEVVETDVQSQILAGSVTSVTTTGLEVEDELELPGSDLLEKWILWDDAV